jgi:hypothetical protein
MIVVSLAPGLSSLSFSLSREDATSASGSYWVCGLMWNMLWSKMDSMETVQIVLDKKLLEETDQAARRTKRNRSALVRDALREHIQKLDVRAREERDSEGYARQPQVRDEAHEWEAEAAWPKGEDAAWPAE